MGRLHRWIESQPPHFVLIACIVVAGLIGIVDVATGAQLFLTVLYLVPISVATWRAGRACGLLLVVLSTVAMSIAEASAPLTDVSAWAQFWNAIARVLVFIFIVQLITNLREARQHADRLARTDNLTGVSNLLAFREISAIELETVQRTQQPLTLMFLDIDDFKNVNDNHGHSVGDEMLREVADALRELARPDDLVARVGGDEFVLLLPRTNTNSAMHFADRVARRISAIVRPDGSALTCSIGLSSANDGFTTIDDVLHEADRAMYLAKSQRARSRGIVSNDAPALRLLAPPDQSAEASAFDA
ncbi:MAG: GGDEF domain-containing protein [Thermomicrobiales bacterium]|nr:GGDEF domain-containing protein [Thermomicrobiales bacterium]